MSGVPAEAKHGAAMPPEFANETESLMISGFWVFLSTDILLFASLFASYAVYHNRIAAGPTPAHVLGLGSAIVETFLLLTSSFTIGLAIWAMRQSKQGLMMLFMIITLLLGAGFVGTELHEFIVDVSRGASWQTSAFLSSFFLLVSTHGAHVSFGILWAIALLFQVGRRGLTPTTRRKIYTFSLYWHFLDVIWVFIFTVVYLGANLAK